jgi:hypothetical protein
MKDKHIGYDKSSMNFTPLKTYGLTYFKQKTHLKTSYDYQ